VVILRRVSVFLLAVSIAMTATTVRASLVLPQNLEQLESQAQLVFVGVCTTRTTVIDERGIPVSVFTFEIIEAVKGKLHKGTRVEIRHFGNDIPNANGLAMRIPGIPTYAVGEEVLLFLNPPSRIGLTSPVGLFQGLFRVGRDARGRRRIVLDPLRRQLLVGGIDVAKYAANRRFTAAERRLLGDPPRWVDVTTFCSLVRKIAQERERAKKQER